MPSYEVSSLSPCEVRLHRDQLPDALWYYAAERAVELLNTHDLQCADLRWPTPLMAQSSSPEQWQQADRCNRQQYETGQPLIEQGDMIHAMQPAHVAEALVLGLRCSEVTHRQGLDPVFPLTVSFFAARHTVQPGSDIPLPRNDPYGLVNLILAQPEPGQVYLSREHTQQYQSFVSMATTGVRSIVIRDRSTDWTAEEVADAIEHMRQIIPQSGRYIPLYQQSTGELLLTPEQFDAARG